MSIEQTGQTPQPLPEYRKLADFIQPSKEQFPETQEIFVIPRMNLPTIHMDTNEGVVPWITTWSNQGKTPSTPTYDNIEQTPYTPIPEVLSDMPTLHLPTSHYLQTASQANNRINTSIFADKHASPSVEAAPREKQRTRPLWKYISAILPRFKIKSRARIKASRAPTHIQKFL
jgi:hypothetical protein